MKNTSAVYKLLDVHKHSSISPAEGSIGTVKSENHFKAFGLKLSAALQLFILTGCWYKLIIRLFLFLINDYTFIVKTDIWEKRQFTSNQGPCGIHLHISMCDEKRKVHLFFFKVC